MMEHIMTSHSDDGESSKMADKTRNSVVLPQVQCVRLKRNRRGALCDPPAYFVSKKDKGAFYKSKELTQDNKEFLNEVIQDRYPPRQASPLKDEPWERNEWTLDTQRTGILGIKLGSIPQWKKDGTKFYTTLIQVLDNHVVNYIPPEEYSQSLSFRPYWKGFGSVVVGALSEDPQLYTKDYCGLFTKAGIPPKRKLTRFLVTPDAAIQPGTPLKATHFKVGDYVDVQARTIGHGFQGVMKRWGFKGGPATHGSTLFHRRPGSISSGKKGVIYKGKKMPGHMGMRWRHLRGLKVWRINTEYNILYITGPCMPGPNHCYIRVFDTRLGHRRQAMADDPPHMPTFYPDEDATEPLPIDIVHEDVFRMDQPTILYDDVKAK